MWHHDQMFVRIAGRQIYLWRAVDSEGEVLIMLVQSRRDKAAALRLMRKLLKNQGVAPTELVTDRLRAYVAAARALGLNAEHIQGKWKNNRAEGSHVPIRLRGWKMQGFCSPGLAQRFHAAVANTFTTCRHLISAATHRQFRTEAFAAWRDAAELAAKSDLAPRCSCGISVNLTTPGGGLALPPGRVDSRDPPAALGSRKELRCRSRCGLGARGA
jgi:IS1 family transposase